MKMIKARERAKAKKANAKKGKGLRQTPYLQEFEDFLEGIINTRLSDNINPPNTTEARGLKSIRAEIRKRRVIG